MRIQGYGLDAAAVWRKQLQQSVAATAPQQADGAKVGPGRAATAIEGLREGGLRPAEVEGPSFSDVLQRAVGLDGAADKAVQRYVRGDAPLHETMIALTKADVSLRLLVNVRNKLLDAYREVMRMS